MEEPDVSAVKELAEGYIGREDGLITVLQEIQQIYGYLPEQGLKIVSQALKIPMSRIFSIATFYSQFYLERRGRNIIRVCRGTACHVRGGKAVLETFEKRLGISDGQTTPDYRFTLETVACLGACAMGPVTLVDSKYYGKMTPVKVETLIDSLP
ncbi:MAG: NADH-quinone oxidoreductase subunit NuoE [Dehalococcoidales bacterium]|nr:NADH-quinone oxidoreductase subunit NuoE [Dehalococcoidales bacterium]MDD4229800.1 NADH-quinone oxidoreductase subunit NuoE [Dehalococcoidales bacterium]MDD5401949.1 NADH-quinone oxidoreductase subunit NuoE [Dehalococcoidales bacterium]